MISLTESFFHRPPNSMLPSDDDLIQYGLTRDQYDIWKQNNPDSRYRKFERTLYDPRVQAFMSAYLAMNGRYVSAARAFDRSLPHSVEKRNRMYLDQDLDTARSYYSQYK